VPIEPKLRAKLSRPWSEPTSDREIWFWSRLFRECLRVLAVTFGFATSTRRPRALNGHGAQDPTEDPGRHAREGGLADPSRFAKAFGTTPTFQMGLQRRLRVRPHRQGRQIMEKLRSDLVGMFLVLNSPDHEHYRTGHIAVAVGNCYLIEFRFEKQKRLALRLKFTEQFCAQIGDAAPKSSDVQAFRADPLTQPHDAGVSGPVGSQIARRAAPTLEPCLPRPAKEPPAGPGWILEIKHDGRTPACAFV
jgi:hypothetical protein